MMYNDDDQTTAVTAIKHAERATLDAQVAQFLEDGGHISVIPRGVGKARSMTMHEGNEYAYRRSQIEHKGK